MGRALDETNRRRERQVAYNEQNGITPRSIVKSLEEVMRITTVADARVGEDELDARAGLTPADAEDLAESGADTARAIADLEIEMHAAARRLEFERAASLRDRIEELAQTALAQGADPTALTDAIERALGARAGSVLAAPGRGRHARRRGR
jgi:excinuclease ABC subunit B